MVSDDSACKSSGGGLCIQCACIFELVIFDCHRNENEFAFMGSRSAFKHFVWRDLPDQGGGISEDRMMHDNTFTSSYLLFVIPSVPD